MNFWDGADFPLQLLKILKLICVTTSGRQITSSKHIVAELAEYITPVYQADTMLPNKKYCFEVCYESCFYLFGRRVSGYQLLSQLCHYVFT